MKLLFAIFSLFLLFSCDSEVKEVIEKKPQSQTKTKNSESIHKRHADCELNANENV